MSNIVLAPASRKQEIFLNSDADITLAGGSAGCFDADTEFLSEAGWIRFADYSGQKVAQYSEEDGKIRFVKPIEYIKKPNTSFKRLQSRGLDFCLSEEHRVPYWNENRLNMKILPWSEVIRRHENSVTKGWTGKIKTSFNVSSDGIELSEGDIRLIVAAQADGRYVTEGKDNYCQMRFSKERKHKRLLELCQKFNLKYKDNGWKPCERYLSGKEFEIIVWPNEKVKKFDGKWYSCSQDQLEWIVDEVRYWDSHNLENNSGTVRYSTIHKENADFIQFAFHACGYNTSINSEKRAEQYTVNASFRGMGFRGFANKDGKVLIETYISTDRHKYCFLVDSGLLLVRRSNKIFISGNSGKTYTSLLIALKFMQHPKATGIIFRRTSKMLTAPGSIWQEAVSMYSSVYKTGLRVRHRENEIIFPNGAVLKFSHMQHESNMYDHKGGQYSLIIFDEATDFTENMIIYLLSRMRNAYVDYKPQMFLMTNPDYHSFLRLWIQDFYLDPQSGIPMEELAGTKRYFVRQGNSMIWYNSLQEAESVHGSSLESGIKTFSFIPATCRDNPPLLKARPDYISNLLMQPRVEMEKLLLGSWFARSESSGLFKREWVSLVDLPNGRANQRIRAWDFAFSKPSEQYPNPDWTRGVLISKDKSKVYTIEDVVSERDRVHVVEKLIIETAIRDGFEVVISIPIDPAAAAGAYAKDLQRRLAEMGFTVRLTKPVKSKITRFAPFSSVAQAGFVSVVIADWNKDFFDELEVFDGDPKRKDDIVDCCSDAFLLLNKEIVLPTITLESVISSNPFNFNTSLGTTGMYAPSLPNNLPSFNY